MDYIYGQLCERVREIQSEYTGVETSTANVNINNRNKTISVDVKLQEIIDAAVEKANKPDLLVVDEDMMESRFHVYGVPFNDLWNKVQLGNYRASYKNVGMTANLVYTAQVLEYDTELDGQGNDVYILSIAFGTGQYDPSIVIFSDGGMRIHTHGFEHNYSYVYNESTSEYELTETNQ